MKRIRCMDVSRDDDDDVELASDEMGDSPVASQ